MSSSPCGMCGACGAAPVWAPEVAGEGGGGLAAPVTKRGSARPEDGGGVTSEDRELARLQEEMFGRARSESGGDHAFLEARDGDDSDQDVFVDVDSGQDDFVDVRKRREASSDASAGAALGDVEFWGEDVAVAGVRGGVAAGEDQLEDERPEHSNVAVGSGQSASEDLDDAFASSYVGECVNIDIGDGVGEDVSADVEIGKSPLNVDESTPLAVPDAGLDVVADVKLSAPAEEGEMWTGGGDLVRIEVGRGGAAAGRGIGAEEKPVGGVCDAIGVGQSVERDVDAAFACSESSDVIEGFGSKRREDFLAKEETSVAVDDGNLPVATPSAVPDAERLVGADTEPDASFEEKEVALVAGDASAGDRRGEAASAGEDVLEEEPREESSSDGCAFVGGGRDELKVAEGHVGPGGKAVGEVKLGKEAAIARPGGAGDRDDLLAELRSERAPERCDELEIELRHEYRGVREVESLPGSENAGLGEVPLHDVEISIVGPTSTEDGADGFYEAELLKHHIRTGTLSSEVEFVGAPAPASSSFSAPVEEPVDEPGDKLGDVPVVAPETAPATEEDFADFADFSSDPSDFVFSSARLRPRDEVNLDSGGLAATGVVAAPGVVAAALGAVALPGAVTTPSPRRTAQSSTIAVPRPAVADPSLSVVPSVPIVDGLDGPNARCDFELQEGPVTGSITSPLGEFEANGRRSSPPNFRRGDRNVIPPGIRIPDSDDGLDSLEDTVMTRRSQHSRARARSMNSIPSYKGALSLETVQYGDDSEEDMESGANRGVLDIDGLGYARVESPRHDEVNLKSPQASRRRAFGSCRDCEVLQRRVSELEQTAEALEGALEARAMATISARASKTPSHTWGSPFASATKGPSEKARLREECDSLRLTVDFCKFEHCGDPKWISCLSVTATTVC